MLENLFIRNLYDLSHTAAAEYLEQYTYPWEALAGIGAFICKLGETLSPEEYEKRGEDVWIAKSATVFPSAYIHGPAIIGPETEVRQGAFIRGNALVGAHCVVGNSTELKNVILFDNVQVIKFRFRTTIMWGTPSWAINPTWARARSPRMSSRIRRS